MIEAIQPIEDRERLFRRRTLVDGLAEESARLLGLAAVERVHAVLQELFRFPLSLCKRTPGALDICASAGMAPVEK